MASENSFVRQYTHAQTSRATSGGWSVPPGTPSFASPRHMPTQFKGAVHLLFLFVIDRELSQGKFLPHGASVGIYLQN